MKKGIKIALLLLMIILIGTGLFLFTTSLGNEIRQAVVFSIKNPAQKVNVNGKEPVKITYSYSGYSNNISTKPQTLDIEIKDTKIVEEMRKRVSDTKLKNCSQIKLAVMGEYVVDLGNGTVFKFDAYNGIVDEDGYVRMTIKEKDFLTQIPTSVLQTIVNTVEQEIYKQAIIYNTSKITFSNNDTAIDVTRKTAIEFLLNICKDIVRNDTVIVEKVDYTISFNNGVKIDVDTKRNAGRLLTDKENYLVEGTEKLQDIQKSIFEDSTENIKKFTTNKISVSDGTKTIEITDENQVEKITTKLIYGYSWGKEPVVLQGEYAKGIRVEVNEYKYFIPANISIGNRYLIYPDGTTHMYCPMQSLDKEIQDLFNDQ